MKEPSNPGSLVTRTEIKDILGVSKARVAVLVNQADFPAPIDICEDGKRPIWLRTRIERYKANRSTGAGAPKRKG